MKGPQDHIRKGKNKIHRANVTEDDEPVQKKERKDDLNEEYVLISTLTGIVTHGNYTWLVDSGASKNMIGYKDSLTDLVEKESPQKVNPSDDYQYPIKGAREASYRLESGKHLKMTDCT